MFRTLKNLLKFRMGQKVARKTARSLGFGALAGPIGLWGGMKAVRKR